MATALPTNLDTPATADAAAASPSTRARLTMALAVVLALAAVAWGVRRFAYARVHVSTDNAQVDGHIVPMLAKVGGYVVAVRAAENDAVSEGASIVQLDDAEYRVRLAQADAELQAARAAVTGGGGPGQADAALLTASSQSAASDAQIAAAQANYDKAQADLGRMKELADKAIVSRQQLDAAQAAADAQRALLLAVQKQAAAAGASVTSAEAGVRLARARLAVAQATRDNAALQLSYTKIAAPASGSVARRTVEVGQLVQPGQTLFSIVPDSGVWVSANFKETQLSRIRVGQPVDVSIDAYDGCRAVGRVESLSAATGAKFALLPPDNATGNFTKVVQRVPVRIAITSGCGPERPLRPGMSAEVHVDVRGE
jgi:membrane fusion protein (multidrug efflux system)